MRYAILFCIFSFLFLGAPGKAFAICVEVDSDPPQKDAPPPSEPSGPISPDPGGPPAAGATPEDAGIDVDIDTGERASGAVDVDVTSTSDTDTDASGIDETGTGPASESGSLPDTGSDKDYTSYRTRITCGEVRDINYLYDVLSVGRRFGTRHYVVTPSTYFSPSGYSFEMIGVGDRVIISYVTIHGMRIAVHITVHE